MAFLAAFLGILGLSCLYSVFAGWMFMLAVGVVHAEWIPQLPTIGLFWSWVIMLLLRLAFATATASSSKD